MDVCIEFYVQFQVRNDLTGRRPNATLKLGILDFFIFIFSDFFVIFGYTLALNVLRFVQDALAPEDYVGLLCTHTHIRLYTDTFPRSNVCVTSSVFEWVITNMCQQKYTAKIKQAKFKIQPFRRNSIFRAQMKVNKDISS